MAASRESKRKPEEVRRDIDAERRQLADAVDALRGEIGSKDAVRAKLRPKLPLTAAGAAGLGFAASGGIGATVRLLTRRRRESRAKEPLGRFASVRHRFG